MNIGEMFVRLTASNEMGAGTRDATRTVTQFANQTTAVTRQMGTRTSADVQRFSNAVLALVPAVTGVHPALARLTSVLGTFAVGGGVVAGAIVAVTALGAAYRLLTNDTREAREEQDKLVASLVKAAQARIAGNLPVMRSELANLEEQLRVARLMKDANDKANASAATATVRTMARTNNQIELVEQLTTAVAEQTRRVREAEKAFDALLFQGPMQDMNRVPKAVSATKPDTSVIDAINTAWVGLASSVRVATAEYEIFGDGQKLFEDRLAAAKTALQELLRLGVDPTTQGIQGLVREIETFAALVADLPSRMPSLPTFTIEMPTALVPGALRPAEPTAVQQARMAAREFFDALAGPIRSFGQSLLGIVSVLAPWRMILEALQVAFGDLLRNTAPIVTLIATALAPVLKAMFPVIKLMAIAATYVGQVFFNVAGGILFAVGNLIKGLGKFLDAIPFVGDFGLIKAGQAMIDTGKGFVETAAELATARDQIKALEWQDALDPLKEAAEETAEALRNVPTGFKVALARLNATVGAPVGDASGQPAGSAGGGSINITGPVTIVTPDPEKLEREIRQRARRGGAVALRPAFGV